MGCASSADAADAPARPVTMPLGKAGSPAGAPTRSASGLGGKSSKAPFGPLSREQYVSRLIHSGSAHEVDVPLGHGVTYRLQYAYVSQRGYYPDTPTKENQDAFVALPAFGGVATDHLFGVFDGHGEKGTQCAQFAADKARRAQCGGRGVGLRVRGCVAPAAAARARPRAAHAHRRAAAARLRGRRGARLARAPRAARRARWRCSVPADRAARRPRRRCPPRC
jgi:hypothetical protein